MLLNCIQLSSGPLYQCTGGQMTYISGDTFLKVFQKQWNNRICSFFWLDVSCFYSCQSITKNWLRYWNLLMVTPMGTFTSTQRLNTTPTTRHRSRSYVKIGLWSRSFFQSQRSVNTWRQRQNIVCIWRPRETTREARSQTSSVVLMICLQKWNGRRSLEVTFIYIHWKQYIHHVLVPMWFVLSVLECIDW